MFIQNAASKGKYVVSVSEFLRPFLDKQGIKVDYVIDNCINQELFKPIPGIKINNKYLFVGRYEFYAKGFDILKKLSEKGIKIDCVTNQNPGSIFGWTPETPYSKLPEIYNSYKALIFPSRFESCGLVALEAMACGLPVLMSNVGIGPDLKKEIPEFVVEGWSSSSIENYIKAINIVDKDRDNFSKRAVQYVSDHHSFKNFKNKWLNLINSIKIK